MSQWAPGDRVWRWWPAGFGGSVNQPLTVIRVNRKTVTVETDRGNRFRIAPDKIEGRVDWNEDA